MNPNEKELLEKTYELSKENNNILRGIRSSNRWSAFFRITFWVLIIGTSVGTYYYIQPYIDIVLKTYKSVQGDLGKAKSVIGDLGNVKSMFNNLPGSINKTN